MLLVLAAILSGTFSTASAEICVVRERGPTDGRQFLFRLLDTSVDGVDPGTTAAYSEEGWPYFLKGAFPPPLRSSEEIELLHRDTDEVILVLDPLRNGGEVSVGDVPETRVVGSPLTMAGCRRDGCTSELLGPQLGIGSYVVIDAVDPALVGAAVEIVPTSPDSIHRDLVIDYTRDGKNHEVVYRWGW